MKKTTLLLSAILMAACSSAQTSQAASEETSTPVTASGETDTAIVAGGCFWCIEAPFDKTKGVHRAVSGSSTLAEPALLYGAPCPAPTRNLPTCARGASPQRQHRPVVRHVDASDRGVRLPECDSDCFVAAQQSGAHDISGLLVNAGRCVLTFGI